MPPPENEVTTLQHVLDLALVATTLLLGVVIVCALFVFVVWPWHERWMRRQPTPWWERRWWG